jgi:putative heme degradation protein
MNNKLKEIAERARNSVPRGILSVDKWIEVYNARFAELIIAECIDSLWSDECQTSDLAAEEFNRNSKKIKQHFGIKQ